MFLSATETGLSHFTLCQPPVNPARADWQRIRVRIKAPVSSYLHIVSILTNSHVCETCQNACVDNLFDWTFNDWHKRTIYFHRCQESTNHRLCAGLGGLSQQTPVLSLTTGDDLPGISDFHCPDCRHKAVNTSSIAIAVGWGPAQGVSLQRSCDVFVL